MIETKTYTLWFGIEDEESQLCGEEWFVEVDAENIKDAKEMAAKINQANFPNETLSYYGRVTAYTAETMGLDTY